MGYKKRIEKKSINHNKLFISYVNSLKLHNIYFFQKPNLFSVIKFPINMLEVDTRDIKNKTSMLESDLSLSSKRNKINVKMYQRLNLKKIALESKKEKLFENKLKKNFSSLINNLENCIFKKIIKTKSFYQKKPKSYFETSINKKSLSISKKIKIITIFGVKRKINLCNKYNKIKNKLKRLCKIKKLWTNLEFLVVNKQCISNKKNNNYRLFEEKKKFKKDHSIIVNK